MTSHNAVTAEIRQILSAFDRFVDMFELGNWLKDAGTEDIKSCFKLSAFIEDSIGNVQNIDLFQEVLKSWWKTKNRTKLYDIAFFRTASDHLLSKIFNDQFVAINTVDIAVRIYTTMYPRERLEKFISSSIIKSASLEAILDYTIDNKNYLDLKELEYRLILRNWSIEAECGRVDDVKTVIANMLSSYKIENCLSVIIGILALGHVSSCETVVQKIILQEIQSRMIDRSILSKHLWVTLFKHVDRRQLSMVCVIFSEFLKELVDFIVYIGSMMNFEIRNLQVNWISDPNTSICADVTYDDLVSMTKFLCDFNENIRKYIELRITQAKSSTNFRLWRQLEMSI